MSQSYSSTLKGAKTRSGTSIYTLHYVTFQKSVIFQSHQCKNLKSKALLLFLKRNFGSRPIQSPTIWLVGGKAAGV
jgi:hypothetical protein